jgi:hypothetical protein
MIKKYLGNVTQIFEENYGLHANQEELQFKRDVEEILSIDEILNSDFDEWVNQLQNFDKGDNIGIRERLFDLKHNLLDLQVKVIVRKQSRAQKDPNMLRIINLLNEKVRLVKDLMNFTLEEEHQIFVPDENIPDQIHYKREPIPKHEKGANRYEEDSTKKNLQRIFEDCKTDENDDSIIDVEPLYNMVSEFLEKDQHSSKFGNIFTNILPTYNSKSKEIKYSKAKDDTEICEKVFSQMTFLYMKISDTFGNINVSKLSNLLLKKSFKPSNTKSIASLFIPLVKEDVDVIDLFGVNLQYYINNDTSIATSFLKKSKIKYIFLYRYVSMLYEQIMNMKKLKKTNRTLFNLIFIRLSFYINVLNKCAKDYEDEINDAHRSFIENTAPIEIFLKQYKQSTNPQYELQITPFSDKFKITLDDKQTAKKYTGVINGTFEKGKFTESLQRTISEKKNIVLIAYGQSIRNESSLLFDDTDDYVFLEDFFNSLDNTIDHLTIRLLEILYKWSHDIKKTEKEEDFVLTETNEFICKREQNEWIVIDEDKNKQTQLYKLIEFLKLLLTNDGTIKKTEFSKYSSRSHLVVNITLGNTEKTQIVLVDVAGFQGYDYGVTLNEILLLDKNYTQEDNHPFFEDYFDHVPDETIESIRKNTPFDVEINNIIYSLIHQLYEIKTLNVKKPLIDVQRQVNTKDQIDFKFYRDYIPSYLKDDLKNNISLDEMIQYLRSQIIDHKMSESFIELYKLKQLSKTPLNPAILNEIEIQILYIHSSLISAYNFTITLQKNFGSTSNQDTDFKNKLELFCLQGLNQGLTYRLFQDLFTTHESLIRINEEKLGFHFDSSVNADVLMTGMYNTDFNQLQQFFLLLLKNLENDFIYFEIHIFNYKLIQKEQSFINRSIIKMKESISDFLVYSLSHGFDNKMSSNILYYVGYPELQCSNLFERYTPYSAFNYNKRITKTNFSRDDALLRVIFSDEKIQASGGCGVDIDRTTLFLVPVIDCNTYEENPPIMPYIDVGEILQYLKYLDYFKQIEKYIDVFNKKDENIYTEYQDIKTKWDTENVNFNKKIIDKIYNHEYYKRDIVLKELIKDKDLSLEDPELTEKILRHINENNELTLVGTLNFLRFQSVLSSNSMMYHRVCEESDAVQFDLEKV